MWSERPDPIKHDAAVRALRSVLPAPLPDASSRFIELKGLAEPEQVGELLREEPGFLWLDGGPTRHFLLRDPLAVISCAGGEAVVRGPGGEARFPTGALDLLEAALAAWSGPSHAILAGFLAYDTAAELEEIGLPVCGEFSLPSLHYGLYDSVLTQDPQAGWTLSGTDAWRGGGGLPLPVSQATELLQTAARTTLPPLHFERRLSPGPLESTQDSVDFVSGVGRLVERIHRGDFFQTNLCRRLTAPLDSHLVWPLYRRLRHLSPAEFGAFLRIRGGRAVLSVSPELFLRVIEGGLVETHPIKGTRRRGETEEEDRELANQLLKSEKDRAELAMIVDVSRNDLARVCEVGSVRVREHAQLMTLPTVHHTVSIVQGKLRSNATVMDLLRASFPAASITGAPKIEAMKAAAREEGIRRGPSMGAIGWMALDGRLELSVAIRTAFTDAGRVFYSAGCGITADSEPVPELLESRTKTSAFAKALGLSDV